MRKIIIFSILVAFAIFQAGCEKKNKILAPEEQQTKIQLDLTGFGNLGANAKYALWALSGTAETVPTDMICDFTVDDRGNISQDLFDVKLGLIQQTNTLVISVEEKDSLPSEASSYRIIAAKLRANVGNFSVGDDYLLGKDLSTVTAHYQVVKAEGSDAVRGIWFMVGDTLKEAGMDLPDISISGWRYESFAVVNSDTFSMGTFSSPAGPDKRNDYGDGLQDYPFPGENFLIDPATGQDLNLDLRGAEIIVKIIPPFPGYSNKIFNLEIFKGTVPGNAAENTDYQLENNSATFPGGTAKLIVKLYE